MTNQDAKLVLSAYRPNGADARDPFFEQALQQAKRDPELMEWFEKQRAFDRVIVAKLRTIEPPAGLNSQILAGLRAVRVPRHSVSPWVAVAGALLVAMMVSLTIDSLSHQSWIPSTSFVRTVLPSSTLRFNSTWKVLILEKRRNLFKPDRCRQLRRFRIL